MGVVENVGGLGVGDEWYVDFCYVGDCVGYWFFFIV